MEKSYSIFVNGYQKMKNRVYYKAFYEIEADRLGNCGNICRTHMYIINHAFQWNCEHVWGVSKFVVICGI